MRPTKLATCLLAAFAGLLLLAGSAQASSPWWHISSGARPTYLKSGLAQSEVQEITTTPGEFGGEEFTNFFLTVENAPGESERVVGAIAPAGEFASEPGAADFGLPLPTAANIQQLLEEGLYGAGNVLVSEEALAEGAVRYLITSVGEQADRAVQTLHVHEEVGTAQARILTEGRADGELVLLLENAGDASVESTEVPVRIADVLPAGLKAVGIDALIPKRHGVTIGGQDLFPCSLKTLTCTLSERTLAPYDQIEVRVVVDVEPNAHSGEENRVEVSGGGAPNASLERPITISGEPTPFGVEEYRLDLEEEGGKPATAAGSHPFQLSGTLVINQAPDTAPLNVGGANAEPAVLAKDINTELPAGLLGNPTTIPTCTLGQFLTNIEGRENACPADSAVGVASITVFEPNLFGTISFTQPVFNLEPIHGEPARFGFYIVVASVPVILDASLRSKPGENVSGGSEPDYGIDVESTNVSQTAALTSGRITLWGAPADPRHDNSRGWGCLAETREKEVHPPCIPSEATKPPPFLAMPTACEGPLTSFVQADSWAEPARILRSPLSEPMPALDACNQLPFAPKIESQTSADSGETGSGLDFNVDFHDEGLQNAKGLIESQVKKAVVTLPEGLTINPSVGEGLGVCTTADIKRETIDSAAGEGCPNASKLGTLEATSPLIEEAVQGSVFLAQQDDKATATPGAENPFDSLIALYLVLKNPKLGVLVKLPLKIEPDPKTGQLVATLENSPQIPLSHFNFHFREGARAPLITPAACGTYTTESKFYPWSNPNTPTTVTSSFQITRGVNGGPCLTGGLPPFHPHFEAGAVNNNAGSFSPFDMRLIRQDGEQDMTKFSSVLPPGELGSLAGVSKCPDAAIQVAKSKTGRQELANPSCPANSLIGHTLAGAGVGESLTYVKGQVYLGGPFHGDPLSVIAVTPAVAGPFDAGTVVVQLALTLNPKTAEVEVDGANSEPIPHILDGIVLKLKDLRVYVDRQNFTLNPTSCEESSAKARLFGSYLNVFDPSDDRPVDLATRYQAANCVNLGFKPKLNLNLKGGTKRGGHPGLIATYKPRKGDANIKGLVVRLPRSAFLDQAHIKTICTRVQFAAGAGNGAQCPKNARYGYVKAFTPLLDEPLEGPVFFRSSNHKLPDLVFALHGLVNIEVDVRIDSQGGGIRATLEDAPDATLSKVVLKMQGAKKGLIINSKNLCAGTNKANILATGHNGKQSSSNPVIKPQCRGKR